MEKEYLPNTDTNIVRIFETNYDSSFEKIKRFVAEVKKDFPTVLDTDINLIMLAGEKHDRIIAVEFVISKEIEMPLEYFKWTRQDELGFCPTY